MAQPKLTLYDLEVSPCLGFFYPPTYQTNILRTEKYQVLMSFSYAEFTEGKLKIKNVRLDDFPARFKNDRWDDTDVVLALHRVLSDTDHKIAYNGVGFDDRMSNTFFIKHGLEPIPETKTIDPLKVIRRKFKFASNRMDEIAKELDMQGKTDITVGSLWYKYMMGSDKDAKKAGKLLKKYNDQDIVALRDNYLKFRPYMTDHPNLNVYNEKQGCPNCGHPERDYLHSPVRTKTMVYRRVRCKKANCGHVYRERVADKLIQNKPDYV